MNEQKIRRAIQRAWVNGEGWLIDNLAAEILSLFDEAIYKKRWEYIKADPDGARHLLLLLGQGKGTGDDFDAMVDRVMESRAAAELRIEGET